MLRVSEAGNFLNLWVAEFGASELSSGDILARASPGLRGFFGGRSSALCSYDVSRFLSGFPGGVLGGAQLVSRVDRGRTLWRVESVDAPDAAVLPNSPTRSSGSSGSSNPGIADAGAPGALVCTPEPADHLASNLRKALRRQAEFLDLPLDPADPRLNRLIAEVANQTVIAVIKAQEKILAAKRDDEYDRTMEARFAERQKFAEAEIERLNAAADRRSSQIRWGTRREEEFPKT